jgi:hypothetical protein
MVNICKINDHLQLLGTDFVGNSDDTLKVYLKGKSNGGDEYERSDGKKSPEIVDGMVEVKSYYLNTVRDSNPSTAQVSNVKFNGITLVIAATEPCTHHMFHDHFTGMNGGEIELSLCTRNPSTKDLEIYATHTYRNTTITNCTLVSETVVGPVVVATIQPEVIEIEHSSGVSITFDTETAKTG